MNAMDKNIETAKQFVAGLVAIAIIILIYRGITGGSNRGDQESVRDGRVQTINTLDNQHLVSGLVESYQIGNKPLRVEKKITTPPKKPIVAQTGVELKANPTGGELVFNAVTAKEYRVTLSSNRVANVTIKVTYTEPGKTQTSSTETLQMFPGSIEFAPFYSVIPPKVEVVSVI